MNVLNPSLYKKTHFSIIPYVHSNSDIFRIFPEEYVLTWKSPEVFRNIFRVTIPKTLAKTLDIEPRSIYGYRFEYDEVSYFVVVQDGKTLQLSPNKTDETMVDICSIGGVQQVFACVFQLSRVTFDRICQKLQTRNIDFLTHLVVLRTISLDQQDVEKVFSKIFDPLYTTVAPQYNRIGVFFTDYYTVLDYAPTVSVDDIPKLLIPNGFGLLPTNHELYISLFNDLVLRRVVKFELRHDDVSFIMSLLSEDAEIVAYSEKWHDNGDIVQHHTFEVKGFRKPVFYFSYAGKDFMYIPHYVENDKGSFTFELQLMRRIYHKYDYTMVAVSDSLFQVVGKIPCHVTAEICEQLTKALEVAGFDETDIDFDVALVALDFGQKVPYNATQYLSDRI